MFLIVLFRITLPTLVEGFLTITDLKVISVEALLQVTMHIDGVVASVYSASGLRQILEQRQQLGGVISLIITEVMAVAFIIIQVK